MIIQIYEIQTPEEAALMATLGVNHIGTVLRSPAEWKDPRIKQTLEQVARTEAKSSLLPLFGDQQTVFAALDYYQPDIVHFCQSLNDGRKILPTCEALIDLQAAIKKRFPEIAIMRSIPVAPPGKGHYVPSLELARRFAKTSDYFLTDTLLLGEALQPEDGFVGITGQVCDWRIADQLVEQSLIPVILAGGLGPENVAEAIGKTHPAGVDSCTGTNARDADGAPIRFQKDPEKVKAFVAAVGEAVSQMETL